MSPIRIPDVSNHQGAVDWQAAIASGVAGGICKATEGLGYRDPTFPANWTTLAARRAVRGAYHFAHTDQDPAAQADWFLGYVGSWTPADLLILDLETGSGILDGFADTFLARVEQRTGVVPWFYSFGPFIRAHITDQRLARYPLWLAAYSAEPPLAPPPWAAWTLWQHTNAANIPGIRTPCDESIGELPAPAAAPPRPSPSR